jgi:hypothetical protein
VTFLPKTGEKAKVEEDDKIRGTGGAGVADDE